jgi:hypothetical protein
MRAVCSAISNGLPTRALFLELRCTSCFRKLILMAQKDAKAEESLERQLTPIEPLLLVRRIQKSSGK